MTIEFTLWSLSAATYQQAVEAGRLTAEHTSECRKIAQDWDLLARVLAAGDPEAPAATAITGGHVLENDLPDYGGTRIFSPYEVALLAAALDAVDEAEFDRRYRIADFTGVHGSHDSGVDADSTAQRSRLFASFTHLQTSYNDAAARGDAVAIWLG
ncbi:MAG: DUF1877 family protein [Catenulispora sp.]|nr:DUF1877 family protein [Catenulispora sp.]